MKPFSMEDGSTRKCVGVVWWNNDWWFQCDDGTKHSGAANAARYFEAGKRAVQADQWRALAVNNLQGMRRAVWRAVSHALSCIRSAASGRRSRPR